MAPQCPRCIPKSEPPPARPSVVRFGTFRRKSDYRVVPRFRCRSCRATFSEATFDPCFRQLKRTANAPTRALLVSGVSQRRAARLLGVHRTTVARKLVFLGLWAETWLAEGNRARPKAKAIVFDDMETFEHTKLKPLSITLAVADGERRVLGVEVSRMPAKGPLAAMSRKKYGRRKDDRKRARRALFEKIAPLMEPGALIKSDESPHYPPDVKAWFPDSEHKAYKGRRGAVVGQGELKKIGFDPIFSLNHTAAMFRDNVKCLARRTWCTTKKPRMLALRLALYAQFHNEALI